MQHYQLFKYAMDSVYIYIEGVVPEVGGGW